MNLKELWKKFWHLLWKDESLKGWFFSLIIIFVFIKFIFFPGLNFLTGTERTLAIVESCSMYHSWNFNYNFNDWSSSHKDKYSSFGISKDQFENYPLKNGFNKGDILFLVGVKPEKVKIGDIILFNANQKNPVIHRVIKIEAKNEDYTFSTIGDNNNGQLSFEDNIKGDQLVGKAVFRLVPYAGWAKLIFYDWKNPEELRGFCNEN